jgi:hypothetical protein
MGKQFLERDGDESGTNDLEVMRECVEGAQTSASTFAHLWVDPKGDGWQPLRIKAHPAALDAANPLFGPDGQPATDYQLRYVKAGGAEFTENPAEADRQWLPKIRRDLLTSAHVRTVPETEPVSTAGSVVLLMCQPLSEAKRRFPVLGTMPDADLKILTDWRPPRAKALVPDALLGRLRSQDINRGQSSDTVSDDALVFWYHLYCVSGTSYPDGAEVAVSGGNEGTVLKRLTLRDDVEGADQTVEPVIRSIPVAQMRAMSDTEGRDPFGDRPIRRFGAANEARAQLYGGVLEDADRRLHPNVFIPGTSTVQGWQLTQRTGDPIILDDPLSKPIYEDFADLASFVPDVIAMLDQDMAAAAGLSETAMGLDASTAQSGVAKEAVIRQAKVALAQMYQNAASFIKRYWRIKVELATCKLSVPREAGADDGAHSQRWWTGSDLLGCGDIGIKAGTGTMMSPAEKQQFLAFAQQAMWVDPEEAMEAGRSTVADDLGLRPNKHEELIDRQLTTWREGPPDGWTPSQPMLDPMTGGPAIDPQTGAPAVAPPSWTPFEPRPTDEDPKVAPVRYRKLRDFIASTDYSKHPPEWRMLVDGEYQRMAAASGVQTVAQQQMAMQQQAQAQADQQTAEGDKKIAADADGKAQDRAFQGEQADQDRAQERSEKAEDRALALATAPPQQVANG